MAAFVGLVGVASSGQAAPRVQQPDSEPRVFDHYVAVGDVFEHAEGLWRTKPARALLSDLRLASVMTKPLRWMSELRRRRDLIPKSVVIASDADGLASLAAGLRFVLVGSILDFGEMPKANRVWLRRQNLEAYRRFGRAAGAIRVELRSEERAKAWFGEIDRLVRRCSLAGVGYRGRDSIRIRVMPVVPEDSRWARILRFWGVPAQAREDFNQTLVLSRQGAVLALRFGPSVDRAPFARVKPLPPHDLTQAIRGLDPSRLLSVHVGCSKAGRELAAIAEAYRVHRERTKHNLTNLNWGFAQLVDTVIPLLGSASGTFDLSLDLGDRAELRSVVRRSGDRGGETGPIASEVAELLPAASSSIAMAQPLDEALPLLIDEVTRSARVFRSASDERVLGLLRSAQLRLSAGLRMWSGGEASRVRLAPGCAVVVEFLSTIEQRTMVAALLVRLAPEQSDGAYRRVATTVLRGLGVHPERASTTAALGHGVEVDVLGGSGSDGGPAGAWHWFRAGQVLVVSGDLELSRRLLDRVGEASAGPAGRATMHCRSVGGEMAAALEAEAAATGATRYGPVVQTVIRHLGVVEYRYRSDAAGTEFRVSVDDWR